MTESEKINKLCSYLNFSKSLNAVYFGIKSIIRNKHKIKMVLVIEDYEITDNLKKDLKYLNESYGINIYTIKAEYLKNINFKMLETTKTIGVSNDSFVKAITALCIGGKFE